MTLVELWDFGDLDATRSRFVERLEMARSVADAQEAACVLTQLARIDGLQGHYAEGREKLAEARALAPEGPSEAEVRIDLETGRIANEEGNREAAADCFQRAFKRARSLGLDGLAVDALHMLAIVAPPERALELAREAESLVEARGEALQGWLGPILNNAGWTLFDLGRYDDAVSCFRRDAALRERLGRTSERQIADWNAGFALRIAGKLDEAAAIQVALEQEIGKGGAGIAYVYEELSELADMRGEGEKAGIYARKALDAHEAEGINKAQNADKIARLVSLAKSGSSA